jgi:hypothetical protein
MGRVSRRLALVALLAGSATLLSGQGGFGRAGGGAPPVGGTVDFVRDIQPILRAHCTKCHGHAKVRGQLRLDNKSHALHGGVSGPVILPGNPRDSRLLHLIGRTDPAERMPQQADPLSPDKIRLLQTWIAQGAPWPDEASVGPPFAPHWAYRKPTRPAPPAVKTPAWVRTPVDAFVLARLEQEGLAPAGEAARPTLLRRLALDLTGLPPTPAEVDAFVGDRRPDAYERQVDRLLASPHYGERWARPWLDLARYADTEGGSWDRERPWMWRYRDWVVQALNRDLPFDRFTLEQLAGDLLPNATLDQKIATGFHRNAVKNEEDGVDAAEVRWETLVDRVDTTATVWLGATLACARCHNHKYDPFPQADYYRLLAFFEPAEDQDLPLETPARPTPKEEIPSAMVLRERPGAEPPATHLRVRGAFVQKGERVTAATPGALSPWREGWPRNRLGLALWLLDPDNPLTARVTVNRLWAEYFGRGLVDTPEDLGTQGSRPSHPELLDWLATELVGRQWSLKAIHRTIVTSATYRQSSRLTPALRSRDPDNRLVARGPRFRLEAEVLRDQALAASGLLSRRLGGPPVFPPQPDASGALANNKAVLDWTPSTGEDRYRRAIYTFWRRTAPFPMFTTFDAPSHEHVAVRRPRTNTPLQALSGLNDPAFVEAARALARRVLQEAPAEPRARATLAFRLCVARSPESGELAELARLFQQERDHFRADREAATRLLAGLQPPPRPAEAPELAAWTVVANVILNLDETLTKE